MNLIKGFLSYIKDWKNLLTHSLIGVGILLVAFYIPVDPIYRVLLLIAVVAFNLIRMDHSKRFLQNRK